jgi:hypothetical protein
MVVLGLIGAFGVVAFRRRNLPYCFLCLTLFPLASGLSFFAAFSVIFEGRSARRLAEGFAALPATTEVACLECFPSGLPFYLHRTLTLFSRTGDELTSNYITYSIGKTGKWPEKIVPVSELDNWLSSHKGSVYLIAPVGRREQLMAVANVAGTDLHTLSCGYLGVSLPPREDR